MEKWDVVPDDATIAATVEAIRRRGIGAEVVEYRVQALEKVKAIIPKRASVMTGSSKTLDQIGFMEHLRTGRHGWRDIHAAIAAEGSERRRRELRRKSVTADFFVGSVNAIAKTGELVACDQTGSRVGGYLFAAKNVVLVAGVQKITEDVGAAMRRVLEHVLPLESERMMSVAGIKSSPNKWIIIEREVQQNRLAIILVKEKLGF
jgi:hypothetical protein